MQIVTLGFHFFPFPKNTLSRCRIDLKLAGITTQGLLRATYIVLDICATLAACRGTAKAAHRFATLAPPGARAQMFGWPRTTLGPP